MRRYTKARVPARGRYCIRCAAHPPPMALLNREHRRGPRKQAARSCRRSARTGCTCSAHPERLDSPLANWRPSLVVAAPGPAHASCRRPQYRGGEPAVHQSGAHESAEKRDNRIGVARRELNTKERRRGRPTFGQRSHHLPGGRRCQAAGTCTGDEAGKYRCVPCRLDVGDICQPTGCNMRDPGRQRFGIA